MSILIYFFVSLKKIVFKYFAEQMRKEENNKKNMKCHVKGQMGASSFELPQVKSSFELARNFNIKLEERKTKHGKSRDDLMTKLFLT